MLKRATFFWILPFILLALIPAHALPENLATIDADNASQIQKLSSFGSALQGQLHWSPDGRYLAIGTSENIQVYDRQNTGNSPVLIDIPGTDFTFNQAGEIISDGQRWNAETGELIVTVEPPVPVENTYPDIEIGNDQNNDTFLLTVTRSDGSIRHLSIDNQYSFSEIIFSSDENYAVLILDVWDGDYYNYTFFQLWDIDDGTIITDLLEIYEPYYSISFFADDTLLLFSADSEEGLHAVVLIWDVVTGERLSSSGSLPVLFSPDGNLLASQEFGGISLWANQKIGTLMYNPSNPSERWMPYLMQFSPDSETIATPLTRAILLWDVSSDEVPLEPYLRINTRDVITRLIYSPDGRYIASIENNGIVEIWDAETGEARAELQILSEAFLPRGVQFSSDSLALQVRDIDGEAYIIDIENNTTLTVEMPRTAIINSDWTQAAYWQGGLVQIVSLETGEITDIELISDYYGRLIGFTPDGLAFFVGESLRGYDVYSEAIIFEQAIADNETYGLEISDDGNLFVLTKRPSNSVEIWELSNRIEPVTALMNDNYYAGAVLFSPDGQYISEIRGACGHGGGGSMSGVWDALSGERLNSFYPVGLCGPYDHVFTPDSEWLIIAWDMNIHINYVEELIAETPLPVDGPQYSTGLYYNNHNYRVRQIILSPDAEFLAVQLEGIESWIDVPSNESPSIPESKIDIFRMSDILESTDYRAEPLISSSISGATQVIFSPDSQWLLTDNGFWNTETGEQLASVSGTAAAFNPDGTILATYQSGQVNLWNVAELLAGDENVLAIFEIDSVNELVFNDDGTVLFVRRAGDLQLWGVVDTGEE